jgi:hypothetical protein
MDTVESHYKTLYSIKSDINEHLPTLMNYASECESVFETGVRGCVSSWAFARGLLENNKQTKYLFMNDIQPCDISSIMEATKNLPIRIEYAWKNNLDIVLTQNFDLTFIDTWHVYGQLIRELRKFAKTTNRYIILHDTTVDEWIGESIRMKMDIPLQVKQSGFTEEEIRKGLWYAVDEFLKENSEWVLHERFTNNNGLTVLKKV